MHEFSICESIVDRVLEELTGRRVPAGALRTVRIAAGRMHQIMPDSLTLAYEVLTADTPAAGSKLEVREVPLTVKCRSCGWQGAAEPLMMRCGACHDADLEITGGRELHLESLEWEAEES